jgi:hypothetical protein
LRLSRLNFRLLCLFPPPAPAPPEAPRADIRDAQDDQEGQTEREEGQESLLQASAVHRRHLQQVQNPAARGRFGNRE